MAVLEKIRVKLGIFISILIAVALLSFIVDPTTLQSASRMISSENKVGEMAGKNISYQDFYEKYNQYTELAKLMGQSDGSEEAQSQIRDAAWQDLFDEVVFEPKTSSAGVFVGKDEMLDLTQGSNISSVLLQQGMFLDENGNFSREALVNFVQTIDLDESGSYGAYWDYLESTVYRTQLYNKYASLLENSAVMGGAEKARSISDNNVTVDVDYVFVPAALTADSTVTASAAEIRDYYNSHKKLFTQQENRDIEYVMWEVVPSSDDINNTYAEFQEVYEEFKEAENLRNFITVNSDNAFDTYYYNAEQLESVPEIKEMIENDLPYSAVHTEETSFSAARIADVRSMSDSAHVYYVAYALTDQAKADSLAAVANKSGMTEEFAELGWLTQEAMYANGLNDFNPVFDLAGKCTVIRSVNNQALFVVYVSERTKPVKKYQIASLLKNVLPSDDTYRDFQMKATELVDASDGNYEKFSQYVKENNLPVIPINNITESTRRIGLTENAREVVRWAFEKGTKKGSVSDLVIVDNKYYFVAAVTGVHKEGTASIADVASYIKAELETTKAITKKNEEIKVQIAGLSSLDQIAEKLGTTVSNRLGLSFGSVQIGSQEDPAFVGAALAAKEGTINTVEGVNGVYVFKTANRTEGKYYTEDDIATAQSRTASYQSSIMQTVIADEAQVKDHRARFF